MKKIIIFLLAIFIISGCTPSNIQNQNLTEQINTSNSEFKYSSDNLKTNTAITSIDLTEVLAGGPPKDGIPAVNNPKFQSIQEANQWLDDESLGVIYTYKNTTRFYPYPIIIWHEIVNDTIQDQNISVTFCPLCGSSVIFNRDLDNQTLLFGVSGKLWQSNLLMYDNKTESLWSQIIGEAVIGDYTGKKLEILPTSTITYKQLKENHPKAEILSKDTGHPRDYSRTPYSGYDDSETLFFPAKGSQNTNFPLKELFVITSHNEKQIGFQRQKLLNEGSANNGNYSAKVNKDGTISLFYKSEEIPHYLGMWFSWISHTKDPNKLDNFLIWPN